MFIFVYRVYLYTLKSIRYICSIHERLCVMSEEEHSTLHIKIKGDKDLDLLGAKDF